MSNIQHKNHNLETFLKHLLSQHPLPQTVTFIYNTQIKLVLQLIPEKGYMIGYNDSRFSNSTNPVMVWCDLYFRKSKSLTDDDFRNAIMLAKDLPLALNNSGKVIFQDSYFELLQSMTQAIALAKLSYAKNTKTLNESSNIQKFKNHGRTSNY